MLNDAFEFEFEFGFELPSLEQIEEMDRQRSQAIESLQITESEGGNSQFVKCQRCGQDIPIVGRLSSGPRPCNGRAAMLQRRIKWMQNYYHGVNDNDLEFSMN